MQKQQKCNIRIMNSSQKMASIHQFSNNQISLRKISQKKKPSLNSYHLPLLKTNNEISSKIDMTESNLSKPRKMGHKRNQTF